MNQSISEHKEIFLKAFTSQKLSNFVYLVHDQQLDGGQKVGVRFENHSETQRRGKQNVRRIEVRIQFNGPFGNGNTQLKAVVNTSGKSLIKIFRFSPGGYHFSFVNSEFVVKSLLLHNCASCRVFVKQEFDHEIDDATSTLAKGNEDQNFRPNQTLIAQVNVFIFEFLSLFLPIFDCLTQPKDKSNNYNNVQIQPFLTHRLS